MTSSDLQSGNISMAYPQNRETRVSQTFFSPDADVIFESADGVLFHIHRKNLESCTGAFPPSEIQTNEEHVFLSETGKILELLFKFTYPAPQPDLEDVGIDVVGPLAEAAEKYEVYPAMNFCQKRMKDFIPHHGVEVYVYATKHDYPKLITQSLPFVIGRPLSEVLPILPQHLVLPWVLYMEAWGQVHRRASLGSTAWSKDSGDPDHDTSGYPCTEWPSLSRLVRLRFEPGVESLLDLDPLFHFGPKVYVPSCCKDALESWQSRVENNVKDIPQFQSFV